MTLSLAPFDAPVLGEETTSRLHVPSSGGAGLGDGTLRGGLFKAKRTEPITKVRAYCVTGYTGTPTLVRIGIWSCTLDANGLPTALDALVASTASDTSLFAASSTEYEKALSATLNKVAGRWYGFGFLVKTTGTGPTPGGFSGNAVPLAGGNTRPRLTFSTGSNSDLPATVAFSGATGFYPYLFLEQ